VFLFFSLCKCMSLSVCLSVVCLYMSVCVSLSVCDSKLLAGDPVLAGQHPWPYILRSPGTWPKPEMRAPRTLETADNELYRRTKLFKHATFSKDD